MYELVSAREGESAGDQDGVWGEKETKREEENDDIETSVRQARRACV